MKEQMNRSEGGETIVRSLIEEFNGGKEMYFRQNPNESWQKVVALHEVEGARPGHLAVATEETGKDVLGTLAFGEQLKEMQSEAEREGAAEFLDVRKKMLETYRSIDESDRSPEGKRKMFEARYRPYVIESVARQLTGGVSDDSRFREVVSDIESLAKTGRPSSEYGFQGFEGWTQADYVDLLKMFDESEKEIREEMLERLREKGIDPEASLALIAKARKAERQLEEARRSLGSPYGLNLGRRGY